MENADKLDRIENSMTEVRVSIATLSGDVRASLGRLDGHDRRADAAELRLRSVERRLYGIPSLAALVALAGLALSLWAVLHH